MQNWHVQTFSPSPAISYSFDWADDIDRLEREVTDAEAKGSCDHLSLAEMECSIDLIDAELLALRGAMQPDEATRHAIARLQKLRGKLVWLIERMKKLR